MWSWDQICELTDVNMRKLLLFQLCHGGILTPTSPIWTFDVLLLKLFQPISKCVSMDGPLLSSWNVAFCSAFNYPLCFLQFSRQILTLLVCFCLARECSESMLLIPLSRSLDDSQHTAANKALIWVAWSSAFRENMRLQETRCYRKTLKTWKSWALWSSTVCGAEFRAEDQGLMGPLPKHVTIGSINRNGSTMGSFAPYGEAKST